MSQITGLYNGPSQGARQSYKANSSQANDALDMLSSGSKLNKPSKNSAAKAITNRLSSTISTLGQASINASNAASLINVAAGAYEDQINILTEMKALAARSLDDSLSASDRNLVDGEFQQLLTQVNDVANRTRWNGQALLTGGSGAITIAAANVAAATNGLVANATAPVIFAAPPVAAANINGLVHGATEDVSVHQVDAASFDIGLKIGGQWFEAKGVTATAAIQAIQFTSTVDSANNFQVDFVATFVAATATEASVDLAFREAFGLTAERITSTFLAPSPDMSGAVNDLTAANITAGAATRAGTYHLRYDGANTVGNNNQNGTMTLSNGLSKWTANITADGQQTVTFDNGVSVPLGGTFDSTTAIPGFHFDVDDANLVNLNFQVAENAADLLTVNMPGSTNATLNLQGLDVSSTATATTAQTRIDDALNALNTAYATIGAQQRRLESAMVNLDTQIEGLTGARSVINDTDVAKTMDEFTQANVMSQISATMMSQAFAKSQELIGIVRG